MNTKPLNLEIRNLIDYLESGIKLLEMSILDEAILTIQIAFLKAMTEDLPEEAADLTPEKMQELRTALNQIRATFGDKIFGDKSGD